MPGLILSGRRRPGDSWGSRSVELSLRMDSDDVLDLFRRSGALLEATSADVGTPQPRLLQCALVLQHPAHAEALGRALGGRLPAAATAVLSRRSAG